MAITNFTGFEDAVLNGVSGSIDLDTTIFRSGEVSFVVFPTTTGVGYGGINSINASGATADTAIATSYVQFWFRYEVKPTSGSEIMFRVLTTALGTKLSILLDSTGVLKLNNAVDALLGTGSTVLSSGTWYKIELKCGSSATIGAYELKINGASELSGTGNTSATSAGRFYFGKVVDTSGNSVEFYYDDCIISDSGFVSGNISIAKLTPTANGSTMSWSAGTGASDYTQVDDGYLVDDANYVQSPTTGNPNIALFSLTDSSTAGISGSIIGLRATARVRENTSVTSSNSIRVRSGGTNSDSTASNLTTTMVGRYRLLETDPSTGVAWTTAGIDGVEVGSVENNAVAVRCSHVLGQVAYIPGSSNIKTYNTNAYANIKTINTNAIANVKTLNTNP